MKCLFAFLLVLTLGFASIWQTDREKALQHIVLCWLKEPGNAVHRNQIIEISKTFRNIPGVMEVRVGKVIPSERTIVDDSFDVAILVVVPDGRRLQEYLNHPLHDQAKQDVLLPLVDKVVVYDFQE
tara:strand:- start:718 stop:1095 length:378 start_codon:yes stop_codon:yes gene_type:complete